MLWAALVASGVAVVSMTGFATWITRRRADESAEEEFSPSADPDDPWAAYRPRPFEEDGSRRRLRLWPVIAGLTGLVLVGGGIAGARQSMSLDAVPPDPTPVPYTVDITASAAPSATTPTPAAVPTTDPVVAPVTKPQVTPAPATVAGPGPQISGSAGCSARTLRVSFTITGTKLSWFGLYVDRKLVKGGAMSGGTFNSAYSASTAKGDHEVEVTAQDKAGHSSRKLMSAHCA